MIGIDQNTASLSWSAWSAWLVVGVLFHTHTSANEPLRQEAYVWQRSWNDSVRQALQEHADRFDRLVVLNAEVTWASGQPRLIQVPLDFDALRSVAHPAGLALRIGAYPGPFQGDGEPIDSLAHLAQALVRKAQQEKLAIAELQIDFDCAASKLDGYRVWIERLRKEIRPVPLTITALPSWIARPGFGELVRATDGYVLQVHSLDRPETSRERLTLCDPAAAQRAVANAASFQVPFVVALPTYGYVVAFSRGGRFVGLSAEGPSRLWPSDVELREVRAEAGAMARLVQHWTTNRPPVVEGVIWYRLPTKADALNWPWTTLSAVMQGREPHPVLRARALPRGPSLFDLTLSNEGDDASVLPAQVTVRWSKGQFLAGDGLGGYQVEEDRKLGLLKLTAERAPRLRLAPGQTKVIGWLRLNEPEGVSVDLVDAPEN